MLVVTRKEGETIRVGDDVRIEIQETKRGNVKIGIDAPREVEVLREELMQEDSESS